MQKMFRWTLLFIFSCPLVACSESSGEMGAGVCKKQSWPGLVFLKGEYSDQLSGQDKAFAGSAFVVRGESGFYLVTAAHVASAKNLSAQKTKDRGFLDLAQAEFPQDNDFALIPVDSFEGSYFQLEARSFLRLKDDTALEKDSFCKRSIDSFNYLPLGAWVPDFTSETDEKNLPLASLKLDLFGNLLHAPAAIRPGSSGAPVVVELNAKTIALTDAREGFRVLQTEGRYLRGLVIRRERFFAHSSFVPAFKISRFLRHLEQNLEREKPDHRWIVKGDVLLRKSPSLTEAAVMSASMSSGVLGDLGNGISMDGGNGISMDGGSGSNAYANSPSKILARVSAYPVSDEGEQIRFQINAFRSPVDHSLVNFPIWFDYEYYSSMRRNTFLLSIEDRDCPPFLGFLRRRLQGRKIDATATTATVALQEDAATLSFQIREKPFSMRLDSCGRPCAEGEECQGAFLPIVEHEQGGRRVIVDLRSLFFTTPSFSKASAKQFQSPEHDWVAYVEQALHVLNNPELRIRELTKTPEHLLSREEMLHQSLPVELQN